MNKLICSLAVLSFVLLSCGGTKDKKDDAGFSDDRVIVKAGDHVLTLGELNRKFKDTQFENPQDEYDKKKRHAELALERFLHIDAARAAGLSFKMDSSTIQQYLAQELYSRDAHIDTDIPDSDIRRFFDKYGGEIQFGMLIVKKEPLIDSLYDLLENDADWDSLVREYTVYEIGRKRGGSQGYVPFGQFDEEIQNRAYDLDIGEYSKPFPIASGWCMVKLFDRIKTSEKYLNDDWGFYKQMALKYSQVHKTDDYKNDLLKDYDYRINWDIIDSMIYLADSVRNTGSLPDSMPGSAYLQRAAFSEQLLNSNMVEFKNGGFTVREYMDIMDNFNPYRSPDLNDRNVMEYILRDIATKRIMVDRAHQLGYDTLQSYLDELKYHEENWLIQEFNKKICSSIDSVTDEDIQKYYDDHPDDFYRPEQIRVSAISLKTEDEAQRILGILKSGGDFYSLARKYSTDKKSAAEGGDLNFFTEKRNTEIFDAARDMKVGEIGGPVEMYGNYWIFKVTQKFSRERNPIRLAKSDIISKIYADRRVEAVRSWVNENKKHAEYILDLDLLKSDLGIKTDDAPQNAVEEES